MSGQRSRTLTRHVVRGFEASGHWEIHMDLLPLWFASPLPSPALARVIDSVDPSAIVGPHRVTAMKT